MANGTASCPRFARLHCMKMSDTRDRIEISRRRVELTVQKQFTDPLRLDQYIVARMQSMSRAEVQRLIAANAITLNGVPAKASHRVRRGDTIVVLLDEEPDAKPAPQPIPLEIVFEDEHLVVLNKQANLIVHPGRGRENWSGTLINGLQYHFEKLSGCGGENRPGVIHRLDRDTTGVILLAKHDQAHRGVAIQFERRKVLKEYVALCYGAPDRDRDMIELRIGSHPSVREKMAVRRDPRTSRPAKTFFEVVERFDGFSYLRLEPQTGRTHQLRVHLDAIGHPIVADKAYSGRDRLRLSDLQCIDAAQSDCVLIDRQALHARRLRFRHPISNQPMDVSVPLPIDFERTLSALRAFRAAKHMNRSS